MEDKQVAIPPTNKLVGILAPILYEVKFINSKSLKYLGGDGKQNEKE